jgi:hypothetical protein
MKVRLSISMDCNICARKLNMPRLPWFVIDCTHAHLFRCIHEGKENGKEETLKDIDVAIKAKRRKAVSGRAVPKCCIIVLQLRDKLGPIRSSNSILLADRH